MSRIYTRRSDWRPRTTQMRMFSLSESVTIWRLGSARTCCGSLQRSPRHSLRTLGSIRHGGRQEIGIFGIKSSVRQCSASSSPPRRRFYNNDPTGLTSLPVHRFLGIHVHRQTDRHKQVYPSIDFWVFTFTGRQIDKQTKKNKPPWRR